MTQTARKFEAKPAVRASVPLLIGLMGPSSSGKTFSALRLATGIQRVTGGDIYGIDTEARRMLHYADQFKFQHLQFDPPHSSLDYLWAIEHCLTLGAKVLIIDSMTHEHTGAQGYLQLQEAEVERMAGSDLAKRERVKMSAWIKPSKLRRQMIDGILQWQTAAFIFCFRAKEKTRPNPNPNAKERIVEMGFMPVAGEELLFEMTVNCLLPPRSNGVPQWRSDQIGEKLMMKLPLQFTELFSQSKSLDEDIGSAMAHWANGGSTAPERTPSYPQPGAVEESASEEILAQIEDSLISAARAGTAVLEQEWKSMHKKYRQAFAAKKDELKAIASESDQARTEAL